MRNKFIYTLLYVVFFHHFSMAQNYLETLVDTTTINIGDELLLTLKVEVTTGDVVHFPKSEKIGAFEVIDNYPIDSIIKKNQLELIKKYALTQFDTGTYELPSLPVIIDNKQFNTKPIDIRVMGVEVDTLKQPMYEIKSISKGTSGIDTDWFYIIGSFIIILLGIGLFFYIKKQQESNLSEDDIYKSPYEKAFVKVRKLEAQKSWISGDAKPYYSEMTSISRSFIEDTFGISAHELTTQEIISILKKTLSNKKIKIDKKVIEEFKRVLKTADLVKFAKSQPEPFEITADTENTQKFVDAINKAYPISIETQSEHIRKRVKRRKKRLIFLIFVPLGLTTFLLLAMGLIYFFNNSPYNLKSLSFNNSKRLLNEEWISSSYGVSGITISTPKVLERHVDPIIQQSLPPDIKDVQQFQLMRNMGEVQILVNCISLEKKKKKSVSSRSIEIILQKFQATDVKYDKTVFENANGVGGEKFDGTFRMRDPIKKKEITLSFEIVLLEKKNILDEVCLFYHKGDKIGSEISQRVFESIRYKKD